WYEVGLHCQPVTVECPFNVVGLTFSPAPTVVLGHNDNIGWGVTNVGWDTQDLYMLEINPDDPLQYRWNGEWRDMTVREEEIRFGDSEETVTIQVRETHLGPIITDNDVDDDGNVSGFNNDEAMALHWTSYETGTIVSSLFALNQASNWDEFRDALRMWDAPSQNFVYADVEGNIGYQTPGRIPVRAAGHTGMLPVDGTTDENEWLGYLPFDYLPSVLNPDRNYIATANQALVPMDYYDQLAQELGDQFGEDANYVFGYRWAQGYRAERIVEMLQASDSHDFDTYQAIHGDNKLIFAEEIAPYVADVTFEDDTLTEARDWMLNWDYQMHMNSPQAALFAQFYVALADDLYNDQLGDVANANNRQMWATTLLMADPENVWWDDINTPETETRDDIIQRAFG
ncbi:MAG: penicillin acylase family protein, partial [Anaerolineae bacterium]|nr:penicillin acylase family protein [Anaerolineae bacterium]